MSASAPTLATFSPRQRIVLELLSLGQHYDQIAATLSISIHTVRRHLDQSAARLPEEFYPGVACLRRLLMYYAVATANDQYRLVA